MQFIDTHSHLYSSQFDEDRAHVVTAAITAGVNTILLPNISSEYTKEMNNLCAKFPNNCFAMMGLHPCDVKVETLTSELRHVQQELATGKYIAVGEIGLDLHWDKSTLEIQKKAFIQQIELAKHYNLPIAIHVRDSFAEAIEIIEKLNDKNLRGVFHCFTGNAEDAERVINLGGFYLGIGGVLTFKNSGLDKTIKEINIQHLILETDSPYLAPTPFRGKRNESKYLVNIAEKLAEIHTIELSEVAQITTENAKQLFDL
ncbi:MAG TPA: TatD family deoxyribonuclease [Flavobacteriales bacterium]|jgi:TatD DNase family protein|nr:TatD family deoxyribonuclease [Flavobacteriales bacterium]